MPSPYPGMDPYLEDPAFWSDFHDGFIVYWRRTPSTPPSPANIGQGLTHELGWSI